MQMSRGYILVLHQFGIRAALDSILIALLILSSTMDSKYAQKSVHLNFPYLLHQVFAATATEITAEKSTVKAPHDPLCL